MRARRIEVVLAAGTNTVDRVEAYRDVAMVLQVRKADGGRLTYHAADERYVLTGTTAMPVTVVDGCRSVTGKTLTFFRSTDRIVVDGDRELRTRTTGGPCTAPLTR
jgi:lipopolysaccharide export system protein LptA